MHPTRFRRRPPCSRDGARRAFTVIEVLTVMGILGILAAILLPAVQGSRERSRQAACSDRLRQVMVAVQNHEGVHGTFPPSDPSYLDPSFTQHPSISIFVNLLPFLEQRELYNRFDVTDVSVVDGENHFTFNANNLKLIDIRLPVYVCPSESSPRGVSYRTCDGPGSNQDESAPFYFGKRYHAGAFTDGLMNTALLSERAVGDGNPKQFDPWRDVFRFDYFELTEDTPAGWSQRCRAGFPPVGWTETYNYSGVNWLRGGRQNTAYNHLFPPNSSIPDCAFTGPYLDGAQGAYTARSFHHGGVNVAFADGHVDFINESIDFAVWQAFATRNGNEPIGAF